VTAADLARQIVLDLPALAPRMTREAFVVSASNAAALATLDAWTASGEPLLTICGPAGSGKTHLLQILVRESAGDRLLAIDDIDRTDEPQELLALVEQARSEGKRVALAGRGAPAAWSAGLKDLETRLNAAPRIALVEPDEALLRAVILKLFRDRQLKTAPSVADYAVKRLQKTFAAAQAFVGALDAASIEKGGPAGLKLAREVVANLSEEPSRA